MKEYPKRQQHTIDKKCECGHYDFNHIEQIEWYDIIPMVIIRHAIAKPKCNKCMCPKYKHEKTIHKIKEDNKIIKEWEE